MTDGKGWTYVAGAGVKGQMEELWSSWGILLGIGTLGRASLKRWELRVGLKWRGVCERGLGFRWGMA